jgi:hypothetical protein
MHDVVLLGEAGSVGLAGEGDEAFAITNLFSTLSC